MEHNRIPGLRVSIGASVVAATDAYSSNIVRSTTGMNCREAAFHRLTKCSATRDQILAKPAAVSGTSAGMQKIM